MDVSTDYRQARGFHCTIYVRPPKEAAGATGLGKLQATDYGLVRSGRLWYRTSDEALVTEHRLTKSRYDHTLYFRRTEGNLPFILFA